MVDDNEDDFEIIEEMMSSIPGRPFNMDWRPTSQSALELMRKAPPDICLVDYHLAGESGLDLMKRAGEEGLRTPLILLTGQGEFELDLKAMKLGAADFLSKNNVGPVLLERSIRFALERKRAGEEVLRHEEQVRQAQKMEVVGQLAGGIAHDFNNLLAVIRGNCEFLLSEEPLIVRGREEITEIQKAALRGGELTRQLLVFGRKQVFQPVPLELNRVVEDINKMLSRIIGERTHIQFHPGKSLGMVNADPIQIQQILMNLILNARDAMPEGGEIMVRTANLELGPAGLLGCGLSIPAGPYVQLSVADTGQGMDPETQKRIFEPFFTTKPVGQGTGLGLSTIYGIVQDLKGTILVESRPGSGTTFKVIIPDDFGLTEAKSQAQPSSSDLGGTETILLVEDEARLRKVMAASLRELGYQVQEAQNGLDALGKIMENSAPLHLLLTDTIMPNMNGLELMEKAKEIRPDLRVIFTSGYSKNVLTGNLAIPDGITMVSKPFSITQIAKKIREVLDRP
jgi:signal transduction histidine kinase